jgi:hypothetical protein
MAGLFDGCSFEDGHEKPASWEAGGHERQVMARRVGKRRVIGKQGVK